MTDLPIVRTSERKTFKECQQKWWWAWRLGLKPKYEDQTALWFGSLIHDALEHWYCGPGLKRGPHPAETFERLVEDVEDGEYSINTGDKEHARWVDAKALGVAMLEGYVEEYGRDDSWHIIAPERAFQVNIEGFRRDLRTRQRRIMAVYAGTFDLVYFDLEDEMYKLGEHKTAKNPSTGHLPLDDQAGSYWLIAPEILKAEGLLKKGQKIGGITYNFLKKQMPDDRERDAMGRALNKDGSVSKRQPASRFKRELVLRTPQERITQYRRIQSELAWMEAARRNPDRITKNPTINCERFCSFHEMCKLHEKGGPEWKELRRAMFTTRDPYADHRKSTEE